MTNPIIEVENLRVRFSSFRKTVEAVRGVSFSAERGERVGIVGESGSGKTMTGRALIGLVRHPGEVSADKIVFDGTSLYPFSDRQMRAIRGRRIAMIMQDPKFSLNPVQTAGNQIMETFIQAAGLDRRTAREKSLDMLAAVHVRSPSRVMNLYPHELSGGMGQRVMIAMMLAADPDLLIADEPTSALDVTVQMQVLSILDDLVKERGLAVLLISHDLNLVASFCDRVLIMYAGKIVESCAASDLFEAQHEYTKGLLASMPVIDKPRKRLPVLQRSSAWL